MPKADPIPFETDGQGESITQHLRQSTITNREREAFRKLFDLVVKNPPGARKKDAKGSDKSKQEAHVHAQHPEATEVLEAAATHLRSRQSHDDGLDHLERFPAPLRRMAAVATQKVQEKQALWQINKRIKEEEAAGRPAPEDPLARLREEQHARIEARLRAAPTDQELWKVLEDKVFSVIRSLRLDKQKSESEETISALLNKPEKLAIMGPNYPSFLVIAFRQLRTFFPSSTMPFRIIPAIKEIGRSSYVLGASTPLYNEVIAASWQMWSDFRKVDELLKEMDNSGLEFDENTLELLQRIQREGKLGMSGREGEIKRLWWNLESVQNGWNRVCEWIPEIQQRQQAFAVRLANEREMQREQLEYEQAAESEEREALLNPAI